MRSLGTLLLTILISLLPWSEAAPSVEVVQTWTKDQRNSLPAGMELLLNTDITLDEASMVRPDALSTNGYNCLIRGTLQEADACDPENLTQEASTRCQINLYQETSNEITLNPGTPLGVVTSDYSRRGHSESGLAFRWIRVVAETVDGETKTTVTCRNVGKNSTWSIKELRKLLRGIIVVRVPWESLETKAHPPR